MPNPVGNDEPGQTRNAAEIARLVLLISGVAIIAVAAITLIGAGYAKDGKFAETSQMVFNSLLPLLGTWVGTVLAYYFSRQNFESASQSVERMVTLTTEQKLGQMVVEKEMLRPDQITMYEIPEGVTPDKVLLKDIIAKLGPKITRLPIVDTKRVVIYIIHQSGIFKFLADRALKAKSTDINTLTLKDLVEHAELKDWISNIVYISAQASVADAKKKMEEKAGCQDLIVTKTGDKTEPMLGWMTNVDIGRLSKA